MYLYVTASLACALSALLLLLSWAVVQQRRASRVSLGDNDDVVLRRKIRAQGNLAEYGPMFVLLIASVEIMSGTSLTLWVLAMSFLIARVMHGIGLAFSHNTPKLRYMGMVLTLIAFVGAIVQTVLVLSLQG